MDNLPEKPTEFDYYADKYAELLYDPLRERFAGSDRFFYERKFQVIQAFFKKRGTDTRMLTWLDVGCGQGQLLRLGRSHFAAATGTDQSLKMLESCSDLEVRHQDLPERLPFESKSFNFITTVCVYHHVPEPQRLPFTQEVVRLLKPGGIFCLMEHNPLNPVTRLIVSRSPVDADAHLMSARRAKNLVASAACTVLDTRYFLLFPRRIHRYLAPLEHRLGRVPAGGQYCMMSTRPS
jgi:SAM-dependent methyltransferase